MKDEPTRAELDPLEGIDPYTDPEGYAAARAKSEARDKKLNDELTKRREEDKGE